jgi:uncharacterized protein (DUF1697 family)
MLRGVNVGGHRRIKMDKLRESFEALGFELVKTFIQSGNVVFKTEKSSTTGLSTKIEQKLLQEIGFPISVISRTFDELNAIVINNPFLRERAIDQERLHVMFLSDQIAPDAVKKLQGLAFAPDRCILDDRELYLYLPNGAGESALMKKPLDRILSVVTTTRNWKTVNSLHRMCKDCG